jgi:hypothetical protein
MSANMDEMAAHGRSRRDSYERPQRRTNEQQAAPEPAPEPEQKPFLLGVVDRVVELLNALWDRLASL